MNCSVTFVHFLSCLCLCLFASKVELTLTALISYGCCEGSMWSLAMRATIVFRPVLTWGFGPRFFLVFFSWVKKQKPRERKQAASLKNSPFLNGIFGSPGGRCRRWNCYDDAVWMPCPLSSKAAVAVYFIHTCGDPIASDALGELVSLFPVDPISQTR